MLQNFKLNEELKKRILAFLETKREEMLYEEKYPYLQKEELSLKEFGSIFQMLLEEAKGTKKVTGIPKDGEFESAFQSAYAKLEKGPINPGDLLELLHKVSFEEYEKIISQSMNDCLDVIELGNKYDLVLDLRLLAKNAIESIDGLEKYNINVSPEVSSQMFEIQKKLKLLLADKTIDIQGIRKEIDKYNVHALAIWDDYLSQSENGENSGFRWIVHNLTHGELKGDFKDPYMSTSLITNNAMGVFGRNKFGLKIKPKHIVAASNRDVATANDGSGWAGHRKRLFLTLPAPIMLPQEVEQKCIQDTLDANGEELNYDEVPIYSEVVVDDFEIESIYYISNGEHELAPDYESAKSMAEERGLPLHELDISKHRAEHGLQPMTDKMKKEFLSNILWKCCKDKELLKNTFSIHSDKFVEEHYQEFSDKFIELKEKGDYTTEDILRAFAEIVRDDLHFGEIAQNIDEQYPIKEKEEPELIQQELPEDKWMGRFSKWYAVTDKVKPNIKQTIIRIRQDMTQTIKGLFKKRNDPDVNKDENDKAKEDID